MDRVEHSITLTISAPSSLSQGDVRHLVAEILEASPYAFFQGLKVRNAAAIAALDAARGESAGWRDIASAPKDGAWVMCWGPDCLHGIAKFSPNPIWAEYPEYTHWMPLPSGPTDATPPETPDERQAAIVAMIRDFASTQDCRGCPNMEPNVSLNQVADAIEARAHWKEGA